MKKLFFFSSFSIVTLLANAIVHTVTVADFAYTPSTTNAVCGDTIKWVWASGDHTVFSDSIPVGANPFFPSINAVDTTFSYQITLAGTYYYHCYFHPMMMIGTIIVTCTNGVAAINNNEFSSAYPNPCSDKIAVEGLDADRIVFYNMIGEKIKTTDLPRGQTKVEINTADLKEGIYFYSIVKEGIVVETKKLIKN